MTSSNSTHATDVLFRPLRIGSLNLPNRIVMAPMTRSFAPGGVPGPDNAAYYRRRAAGGVGLIVTEGTVIDRPASRNEPDVPSFYGEQALAGWRQVVDAVHEAGGLIAPQLWHTGSTAGQSGWEPPVPVESPSALIAPGQPRGEAMSEEAIADTVDAFGHAAAAAIEAGFDAVELHGAHGYLIDQFFWSGTNLRDDPYGGETIGDRSRFAAEVLRAVRTAVGPDVPVILRVSQWKQMDFSIRLAETPDEMAEWLVPLVEAGANVLHCSQRRFWEPEFPEIDGHEGMNLAGWAKKLTGAATISVGSVGLDADFMTMFTGEGSAHSGLDDLVERMERDEFDLIAVGRALLTDPDWADKVREGRTAEMKGYDPASMTALV